MNIRPPRTGWSDAGNGLVLAFAVAEGETKGPPQHKVNIWPRLVKVGAVFDSSSGLRKGYPHSM